ncbi:MAG: hypothetical protein KOO63_16750 [Bacteroidales bacterium]|nr:hypothetical protein [Candidatus Latescibacterota bacterium]
MFVTQEKILKKIHQDRQRGDLKRALNRALDGLQKWPDDFNLSIEAIQLCLDTSDYVQAVTQMKAAIRQNPSSRSQILSFARETFIINPHPILGSFIIELLMRSRDIESIRSLLRTSPSEFVTGLVKKAETRSKGLRDRGDTKTSSFTDNEILLGLLYMSTGNSAEASSPLGRALANSPESVQVVGELLLELERDLPGSASVKFTLGLASFMLGRPEKAEDRFFQCIELSDPPLDPLLKLIDSAEEHSPSHFLLKGELFVRLGRPDEGIPLIRDFLEGKEDALTASTQPKPGEFYSDEKDRLEMVMNRLSTLPEEMMGHEKLALLAADTAASLDHVKEAVELLETLFRLSPTSAPAIIVMIDENDTVARSGPAQRFMLTLKLATGNFNEAASAARIAAEMNPAIIRDLIETIKEKSDSEDGNNSALLAAMAELHALAGDSESATGIIEELEKKNDIEKDELFRITGSILDKCGVTLDRVVSAIDLAMRNGDISSALPWAIEFFRNNPDAHREFASRLGAIAGEDEDVWNLLADLLDSMASEDPLTRPLKLLQADAHMHNDQIEKAVFEFDQMIMFDDSLRLDLIPIYEKAAVRHPENTTLNLALYQLHLDEEIYSRASHYLCRTLKSDPSQIRDVLSRFKKLTDLDPGNSEIWEELLKAALAMNHADLAREVLGNAVKALPPEAATALNIYGAKISSADGKSLDSLKFLAEALGSNDVDLISVEEQLITIIGREPMNPEARYLAGETLLRLNREEEAAAQMVKCIELSPEYIERVRTKLEQLLPISVKPWLISRILGEISWKEGRKSDTYRFFNNAQKGPSEALGGLNEVMGKINSETPSDNRIMSIYARGLALEGRYAESVEILEELFDNNEKGSGRIMEILLELLEKVPSRFDANRLLAKIWVTSGDTDRSIDAVLRMLSNIEMDQKEVESAVEEFLHVHDQTPAFLVPWAGLKARTGNHGEALSSYRKALNIDPTCRDKALDGMSEIEWPDKFAAEASILKSDCLIEKKDMPGAFVAIQEILLPDGEILEKIIDRIKIIAGKEPSPDYYEHGCRLLATAGELKDAEELVREGCKLLWTDDRTRLLITLAENLESHGDSSRAARIFSEVLEEHPDRQTIWKRIEQAWLSWSDREIEDCRQLIEDGTCSIDCSEKAVRLAIDKNQFETALALIGRSQLSPDTVSVLRALVYLSMDRPLLALAVTGSSRAESGTEEHAEKSDDHSSTGTINKNNRSNSLELLYIEGRAAELIGDHGRAVAAYMKILSTEDTWMDARSRVATNYSDLIGSQFEERTEVLEKISVLTRD